jgi:hypothetical protein
MEKNKREGYEEKKRNGRLIERKKVIWRRKWGWVMDEGKGKNCVK